jgi:hypothetical protein
MEAFPHLKFIQKIIGRARLNGGGRTHPISAANQNDRQGHSGRLQGQGAQVLSDWDNDFAQREDLALAPLENDVVPVFLQINPEKLNALPDFDLASFGIEIISQEDDGYIVGATVDKLRSLADKIRGFIQETHGTGLVAELWQIIDGRRDEWKPRHILSEYLLEHWAEISDEGTYKVEVGIAFDRPLPAEPNRNARGGETRYQRWLTRALERDNQLRERETHFEDYIQFYGRKTSNIVNLEDSFGCEVEITGKGLKDLVYNYPYVFEVNELEEIGGVVSDDNVFEEGQLEVLAPHAGSPIVGIIDSGFMEGHRYLEPASDHSNARSYITGDPSTADRVREGGHGTRVAGAALYPLGLSQYASPYQLPFFVRNIRVLDGDRGNFSHRYPAELIRTIVNEHPGCKIFNLSIASTRRFRRKHMSTWAACLDQMTFEENRLFIVAAGNLARETIREYIQRGILYPLFLLEPYCAIANPGQSCFALTVGSINHITIDDEHWESLGAEMEVSAFSRIGPGIWNTIKPDIVEYGGGFVLSKNGLQLVRATEATSPELLRSTLDGGPAVGRDAVGTSFSAPKVAHIAARLQELYPSENVNLLRALIIQGARLPNDFFQHPTAAVMGQLGFGIPSLDRVTRNSNHRATFYNTQTISAEEGHLYSLKIPEAMRGPGDDYDILIEVTLTFSGRIRRTRQGLKSYMSTWLTWDSSKIDEPIDEFRDFALKIIEGRQTAYDKIRRSRLTSIDWKLGRRSDQGEVEDYSRGNNTVQKDWAIIKSYDLREEIGFVVAGHKGWDKSQDPIPYAMVVSLEILGQNIPIYESLRVENELELENESEGESEIEI